MLKVGKEPHECYLNVTDTSDLVPITQISAGWRDSSPYLLRTESLSGLDLNSLEVQECRPQIESDYWLATFA